MKQASLLEPYKNQVENKLKEIIPTLGEKTPLRDACEYALLNGGKRFRPIIVLMIAEAIGKGYDASQAALAVEFFHTASLIADDLPCMDNDEMRRNKPTLHKVYGESTALLSTYGLIAAGYELLGKNSNDKVCSLALQNVGYNTGLLGATGGQYLDLSPPKLSLDTIREVIHRKTVSLFEISFVLGWLYGGGDIGSLNKVKKAASHFGMAFQIADDIEDQEQDAKNKRFVNMATLLGAEKTLSLLQSEVKNFQNILKELKLDSSPLSVICNAKNFCI